MKSSFLIVLIVLAPAHATETNLSPIVNVLSNPVTPALDCQVSSCSDKYVGRDPKNPPTICHEYNQNQNAFLAEYADGTVAVNPVALEEAIAFSDRPQRRRPARNRPVPRGENPRLVGMLDTVTPNAAVRQRFLATIELLKSTVREQITQGLPDSELNPHQRYLANRIDQLEVIMEPGMNVCAGGDGHPFNARYQGTSNTMYVCPFLSNLAPESFLPLLAHELGHFADPCNYAEIYRFNPAIRALSISEQPARIRADINRCLANVPASQRTPFIDWATSTTRLESRGLPFYQREGGSNPNKPLAEQLVACGIVSAPDTHPPTSYAGTPYLPILSCVNQRHSSLRAPITEGSLISPSTCEPGREGRAMETIADYVSSSVIARMINRNPQLLQRGEALPLFYTSIQCSESGDDPTYLPNAQRMTVFLRPPGVQRILNCDGASLESMCPIPDSLSGSGN